VHAAVAFRHSREPGPGWSAGADPDAGPCGPRPTLKKAQDGNFFRASEGQRLSAPAGPTNPLARDLLATRVLVEFWLGDRRHCRRLAAERS
jgi:hypothetical protein